MEIISNGDYMEIMDCSLWSAITQAIIIEIVESLIVNSLLVNTINLIVVKPGKRSNRWLVVTDYLFSTLFISKELLSDTQLTWSEKCSFKRKSYGTRTRILILPVFLRVKGSFMANIFLFGYSISELWGGFKTSFAPSSATWHDRLKAWSTKVACSDAQRSARF